MRAGGEREGRGARGGEKSKRRKEGRGVRDRAKRGEDLEENRKKERRRDKGRGARGGAKRGDEREGKVVWPEGRKKRELQKQLGKTPIAQGTPRGMLRGVPGTRERRGTARPTGSVGNVVTLAT